VHLQEAGANAEEAKDYLEQFQEDMERRGSNASQDVPSTERRDDEQH
jgi:hypothetical protein